MEQPRRLLPKDGAKRLIQPARWGFSTIPIVIAATLLLLVLRMKLSATGIPRLLMGAVAASFFAAVLLGTYFLLRALREHRASEERLQQMASNIREIFWMIDADSKRALYVNEAYEAITGRSCRSLMEDPSSYEEVIHPEDRARVRSKLEAATESGHLDETFRINLPDGEVRWVHVLGFPVRNAAGKVWRLVGSAQEITEQKRAEDQVARNLAIAEEARAEAEALRKAALALTQNLHMDLVLDALLRSLEELIPYSCARVLVPEGGPHVLTLGERFIPEPLQAAAKFPLTLIADQSPFLRRLLEDRKSILIPDTKGVKEWQTFKGHAHLRSWLSVPLVASDQFLGFLSVGHAEPNRYTHEHLRRAEVLAIPAAAAIQNARLFARAEIYASELEKRLVDLREAESALAQAQGDRQLSEDKFQKVFRSSPIPFSITTLQEGRFLDVNAAFERRYGYLREEVLGHTVHELLIWEEPADRRFMIEQLQRGSPIRSVITRLRTKSGAVKLIAYSADRIHFDGQSCVLGVSEDLPEYDQRKAN
jgi:PAS domain S-box-containing protein